MESSPLTKPGENSVSTRQQPPRHAQLTFYPAYCYRVSPTYGAWVKIRAVDLYRLTTRPATRSRVLSDPGLYFFQNHPIRYFCLAGIILSRDDYENRTCLVLDDCSGVTIEITCAKRKVTTLVHGEEDDHHDNAIKIGFAAVADQYSASKTTPMVTSSYHITASTASPIDITPLQPCTRVKVKGTLSTLHIPRYTPYMTHNRALGVDLVPPAPYEHHRYRLHLERFQILPDLASEMQFWNERIRMLTEILCSPWYLTEEDERNLKELAEEEALAKERKVAKLESSQKTQAERARKRLTKDKARLQKRWEMEEVLRRKEIEKIRQTNRVFQERLRKRNTLDSDAEK
ncbi:hypothetical protein KEM56_004803 [Ascosphaera pollenicola]|nr:hypothetical protein KEM56_004803 [Ascosphaera pollenicola]